MYRLSELSEQVVHKRPALVSDGRGGYIKAFDAVATMWAHVRPLSGKEQRESDRTEAAADYLFVVRGPRDIKEEDVLVWCGREYNVRFVGDRSSRRMYLEIRAERGVAS